MGPAARPPRAELGCAAGLAVVCLLSIGGLTYSFTSMWGLRDLADLAWWFALFLGGAFCPAVALLIWGSRSRRVVIATTLWMLVALILSFGLAVQSGGGV